MNTLELARRDAAFIINSGGFESEITFHVEPEDVVIKGTATKHHMLIDPLGERVNSKQAQITVNEADLIEAGITTRRNNEVYLNQIVISYFDSSGLSARYYISESFANETLGHIVCILKDIG